MTTATLGITIIEDNAGGLILQLIDTNGNRYQHTYDAPEDLAADISIATQSTDFSDWDQNEAPDFWIDAEAITSNGAYRAYGLDDIAALYPDEVSGATLRELIAHLQTLNVIPA